jgi:hypothetical protein
MVSMPYYDLFEKQYTPIMEVLISESENMLNLEIQCVNTQNKLEKEELTQEIDELKKEFENHHNRLVGMIDMYAEFVGLTMKQKNEMIVIFRNRYKYMEVIFGTGSNGVLGKEWLKETRKQA